MMRAAQIAFSIAALVSSLAALWYAIQAKRIYRSMRRLNDLERDEHIKTRIEQALIGTAFTRGGECHKQMLDAWKSDECRR